MKHSKESTFIGVDLGGTKLRVGKFSNLNLISASSYPVSADASEDVVLDEIYAAIDTLFDSEVKAIGLAVPSVVDVEKGIIYNVENIPSWQEVHLKELFEKRYKVDVFVNNDANAFVLGEAYSGKGKSYKNIVGLTLGTGMGCGIVIDGKLYNGSNCGAGEIGTMKYKNHTLEYYGSGEFFKGEFGVDGAELYRKAKENDEKALKVFEAFGEKFGEIIMIVLYTYDPDIIIIGGSVSKSYKYFEKSMRKKLKEFAYPHIIEKIKIEISEHDNIPLVGAIGLCFDI